jgi:deoxyadenosine/deoxycytidine kinase
MKTGHVVWVEGLIGSGKTTVSDQLGDLLKAHVHHEPVDDNPFLADFYKDPKAWAFVMQFFLMSRRYRMQKLAVAESLNGRSAILDRGLPGDRVFARLHTRTGNIDERSWKVYEEHFDLMMSDLRPPSLLVFLDVEPETAYERMKRRARGAEVGVPIEYLRDLRAGYYDLLEEIEHGNHAWSKGISVMRVPWNVDFQDPAVLADRIVKRLEAT